MSMRRAVVRAVSVSTLAALALALAGSAIGCGREKVAIGDNCNFDVECDTDRCLSGFCASVPPHLTPTPVPTASTAPTSTPTPDAGAGAETSTDGG